MYLSLLDNCLVVLFALALLAIGYYFSNKMKDMKTFYLGNRSLPTSLMVGVLVATWYGGVGTIGTVEYAAIYGLSIWLLWCVTAHTSRIPLAMWIGPGIHLRTGLTVPDLLETFYGKGVAILGAALIVIYSANISDITVAGFLGSAAWGLDKMVTGSCIVALAIAVASLGGLLGVAITDMVLFWLMVVSIAGVFPGQWIEVGGWQGIKNALHDLPDLIDPVSGITPMKALMLMMVATRVYAEPIFYQRFAAGKTPDTARKSLLICFSLWICLDILLTLAGLIVRIKYPELPPAEGYIKMILSNLPVGLRAMFVIGVIGSIISNLDGFYLTGGTTFAYDIVGRLRGKTQFTQTQLVRLSRLCIIAMGIGGLFTAFRFATAQDALIFLGSLWMSAGFVPVLGALLGKGRCTANGGALSMLLGISVFCGLKLFPLGTVEPLVVAIPVSFAAWLLGNRFGEDRRKYEQPTSDIFLSPDSNLIQQETGPSLLDWGLVGGYGGIVLLIYCGIQAESDWLFCWGLPGGLILVCTAIFLRYIMQVSSATKAAVNGLLTPEEKQIAEK